MEVFLISNTANDLFLYVTYRFFSLAYQTLITIFGNPTFIYSRHGFYKYILFSFFHLFLRKSVGKGTEKYFPLTLMLLEARLGRRSIEHAHSGIYADSQAGFKSGLNNSALMR